MAKPRRVDIENLVVGQFYCVHYKVGAKPVQLMIAKLIGIEEERTNWSLRPVGGTQPIQHKHITSISTTPLMRPVLPHKEYATDDPAHPLNKITKGIFK